MLTALVIILVALFWGITNPLMKQGSTGIKKVASDSAIKRTLLEIKFLFTSWKYLLPFSLNQCGSVLYFLVLQNANLSIIVPVTNSLTFVVTTLTSLYLGERIPSKNTCLGMSLIFVGASCCFFG